MHLVLITKVSHLNDIDISREISLLFKCTPLVVQKFNIGYTRYCKNYFHT